MRIFLCCLFLLMMLWGGCALHDGSSDGTVKSEVVVKKDGGGSDVSGIDEPLIERHLPSERAEDAGVHENPLPDVFPADGGNNVETSREESYVNDSSAKDHTTPTDKENNPEPTYEREPTEHHVEKTPADTHTECSPGAIESCFDGPIEKMWTGICRPGSRICLSSGKWDACRLQTRPKQESCNGKDDDCDGQVDNDTKEQGQSCNFALPGKCSTGKYECASGALRCLQTLFPSKELCNTVDDDCNGKIDDGCEKGCVVAGTYPRPLDGFLLGKIWGVTIHPNGQTFLTYSLNEIREWELATGKFLREIQTNIGMSTFQLTKNASLLYTADRCRRMYELDVQKGLIRKVFESSEPQHVHGCTSGKEFNEGLNTVTIRNFNFDGLRMDKWIEYFNATTGAKTGVSSSNNWYPPPPPPFQQISNKTNSHDNKYLGFLENTKSNNTVSSRFRLVDLSTYEVIYTADFQTTMFLFAADKKTIIIYGDKLVLWDLPSRSIRSSVSQRTTKTQKAKALALKPDGSVLAYALENALQIWNLKTNTRLFDLPLTETVRSMDYHPTKDLVALLYKDKVELYDTSKGTLLQTLTGAMDIRQGFFQAGGQTFLANSSAASGGIFVWDINTGKLLRKDLANVVAPMMMSRDGKLTGNDGQVWNPYTNQVYLSGGSGHWDILETIHYTHVDPMGTFAIREKQAAYEVSRTILDLTGKTLFSQSFKGKFEDSLPSPYAARVDYVGAHGKIVFLSEWDLIAAWSLAKMKFIGYLPGLQENLFLPRSPIATSVDGKTIASRIKDDYVRVWSCHGH